MFYLNVIIYMKEMHLTIAGNFRFDPKLAK